MPATDPVRSIDAACSSRGLVTVIGMVVSKLDAYRTSGSSYCITFELKDYDFDGPDWANSLKIKYFNDNESKLPPVLKHDVVLLRNIRVGEYKGKVTGAAYQGQKVPWAIFRHEEDSTKSPSITTGPDPFSPTAAEKRIALALLDKYTQEVQNNTWRTGPPGQNQVVQAIPSAKKKSGLPMTLIKDLEANCYVQIVGQVVKDHNYESDKSTIWITDYTVNESLVDYKKDDDETGTDGDKFGYLTRKEDGWPGPWGKLTMQVTLWDPHAAYSRNNVKPGDLVLLGSVRPKYSNHGNLEGVVHEDKKFPEKVHLRTISSDYSEEAQELMKRRKAYWEIHGEPKTENKQSKKQKKKATEKEKSREEGQTVISATLSRAKRNPNVKTREFGIPVRSVDSILSAETHIISLPGGISYKLPFQNVAYNIIARVVDFFPPDLADFAVQVRTKTIAHQSQEHRTWEWRFYLLVEGIEPVILKDQPREQMKIFVSGAEAEHLLCLDPTDLRQNPSNLNELREKLFLLWGNLEEKKREGAVNMVQGQAWTPPAGISGVPMQCCIKEYGVTCVHSRDPDAMQVDGEPCGVQEGCFGWERRFSLYGTTIHE
ncbi:uncharacterized protein N7503_005678 [Penicillium pulvis]|uniref:uncharacterized protein n=1 Tax=Penicillium pulvis TaxID=1562058 RepID=UPI0025492A1F|nr:uncharacterized protein N7503_005678 [Penicillium pulvis]KAJ5803228.1 hypothetical protein N7503_005678 [Penicillium pulvis]